MTTFKHYWTFSFRQLYKSFSDSFYYLVTGANLEVANHVIISHPYCPPHIQSVAAVPLAQAQAFEQQAVGRVLRFPQTKDVFLYR